jgi:nucleoside 2-deoxyribosyltransferase
MLRKIKNPTIYTAGPEVFNMRRSDQADLESWGSRHGFRILHPRRHSHLPVGEIYHGCVNDANTCDVIILDLNDFRGKCADDGTCVELGLARRSGAILLGYKEKQEDPIARHGPARTEGGMPVDENGYFIETTGDRNVMIAASLDGMFYGPREQVLEDIALYVKNNVVGWYRHEDPVLGRKLLPPDTEELFETITPNFEVDLTRFRAIAASPEMRRHREVKQLGALFWEYPDATHTRYAHSVLTYKIAHDMLQHLSLEHDEKRHVLAYAFLHDIGHTPYSHELEEITALDQTENAKSIIRRPGFQKSLQVCDIDIGKLLEFFDKVNPLRSIVSDKVLGADKLAYLLRDGIATGKSGHDNIDLLIRHTVFEDGVLGVDEKGAESALKQILLYYTTYANTYYTPNSKLNQRIYTLLGQIGMASGILPPHWHQINDLWYDHYNIAAEEAGNAELKKLGANGIVQQKYKCFASMRLSGAENLEKSGIRTMPLTEDEYRQFMKVKVPERKTLEDRICNDVGVEPLDILIAHGGNLAKLKIDDTLVFKNGIDHPVRLLSDLHPEIKRSLEEEVKKQAFCIRFYARQDCMDRAVAQIPLIVEKFREYVKDPVLAG